MHATMKLLASLVLCLMLAGCGTSSSSGGGGNGGSTAGQAQGVYSGTVSSGSNSLSFTSIVLPNDKFYGVYGTESGNVLLIDGMVTGQGASVSGTYTASVTDYYYTGATYAGSVNVSYVPGSSVNGTYTESGTTLALTGNGLASSQFNFNVPASLSLVSGNWSGTLLDGSPTTVTISSNGSVTGNSQGCSFSGTVAADSSNKNFYDVSLTFGGSPCLLPNQTATGIGVQYLLSDGVTQQLVAAVTVGTSEGTVFVATR